MLESQSLHHLFFFISLHPASSIASLTATVSSRQIDETMISIADFFPPN
jgi:hypothetical protein